MIGVFAARAAPIAAASGPRLERSNGIERAAPTQTICGPGCEDLDPDGSTGQNANPGDPRSTRRPEAGMQGHRGA